MMITDSSFSGAPGYQLKALKIELLKKWKRRMTPDDLTNTD